MTPFHRFLVLATVIASSLPTTSFAEGRIQIAIVLDVSESMNGFTEAVKGRILTRVEALVADTESANVELGLLAFGFSGRYDYRVVSEFTNRSGDVRAKLAEFGDSTLEGGTESCGAALEAAWGDLAWSNDPGDQRMIIIAGNERFDAGNPSGTTVAERLRKRSVRNGDQVVELPIIVHTIHAGPLPEGKRHEWDKGARVGGGTFENVSPFDPR